MKINDRNINEQLENIIDLVRSSIKEVGYKTKRYSESKRLGTTAYDCLVLKSDDGKEYNITFDANLRYNRDKGKWENGNDIKPMRFYEFSASIFGYYALIGAESEEKAMEFYQETVADIEEEGIIPDVITKEEANQKLMNICKDKNEKKEATEEFNKCIEQEDPYLILLDVSLL